jgi:hypothetical protein
MVWSHLKCIYIYIYYLDNTYDSHIGLVPAWNTPTGVPDNWTSAFPVLFALGYCVRRTACFSPDCIVATIYRPAINTSASAGMAEHEGWSYSLWNYTPQMIRLCWIYFLCCARLTSWWHLTAHRSWACILAHMNPAYLAVWWLQANGILRGKCTLCTTYWNNIQQLAKPLLLCQK